MWCLLLFIHQLRCDVVHIRQLRCDFVFLQVHRLRCDVTVIFFHFLRLDVAVIFVHRLRCDVLPHKILWSLSGALGRTRWYITYCWSLPSWIWFPFAKLDWYVPTHVSVLEVHDGPTSILSNRFIDNRKLKKDTISMISGRLSNITYLLSSVWRQFGSKTAHMRQDKLCLFARVIVVFAPERLVNKI